MKEPLFQSLWRIVVTPYACWAWADVGIVTAINAAMDAAVATRLRNLRAIHSSI
jgi:hypothetical protein